MKRLFKWLSGNKSQTGRAPKKEQISSLGENIREISKDEIPSEDATVEEKPMAAEKNEESRTSNIPSVYNLIVLDESGSMDCVRRQTVSGCNETLNGIRATAKESPEIRQFVSIFCFDTTKSRYLFQDCPIEEVKDLTFEDYSPSACTPLYDAIGYTVSQLKKIATSSDAVGKVTIITDGLENASKRWSHADVVRLIESLKKKGWLFTFIGANIDVERTSNSLGIDSYMEFEQSDEGMRGMFEAESRSQRAYSRRMAFMRTLNRFTDAEEDEKAELLGAMNENYFTDKERIAPDIIRNLASDEVFVFGSNIHGAHNGGAAGFALGRFGAIMGQAEGEQGQCYAIPTDGTSIIELQEAVNRFTEHVALNPKKKFMLTAIGCGNAGYTPAQIAPLFKHAYSFGNVYVPSAFLPYVEETDCITL